MARDLDIVRRYCAMTPQDEAVLRSPAAPIVVLPAEGHELVAVAVPPGQRTLGFMLPYIPLHHLLLERIDRPIVLTSGDLSDEPQCIGNDEARLKLAGIADYGLFHDRDIVNRIDDSVTRVTGREARVLRRDRLTVLDETECVFQLAPQGQNRRRRREALRQRNRRRCTTTCSGLPIS